MKYAKRQLEKIYKSSNSAQRSNFAVGGRSFESVPGGLNSSDVIIDCPPGMEHKNETCGE